MGADEQGGGRAQLHLRLAASLALPLPRPPPRTWQLPLLSWYPVSHRVQVQVLLSYAVQPGLVHSRQVCGLTRS